MTNLEKYLKKVKELGTFGFALKMGKLFSCYDVHCDDCAFSSTKCDKPCTRARVEWAFAEYTEPLVEVDWSKVPVDTKIWIKTEENDVWWPRYFAKYENGIVYAWDNGRTSFSNGAAGADPVPCTDANLAEGIENE